MLPTRSRRNSHADPMCSTLRSILDRNGRSSRQSRRARLTLESATQTLENLFSGVIESENEGKNPELERIGRLPVSRVINELRFYIRLVNSARSISVETKTRSPGDLAKYLVSSYVRRMTGRFHDRSVSRLGARSPVHPNIMKWHIGCGELATTSVSTSISSG